MVRTRSGAGASDSLPINPPLKAIKKTSTKSQKKTPPSEPKSDAPNKPSAHLSEFKVVYNFDAVLPPVATIPSPVATIPSPPMAVVTIPPPSLPPPPLEVVTIPPPPPQDDEDAWWNQPSFRPSSPSGSSLPDTIELPIATIDGLCKQLQYYAWPGERRPVRSYRKFWANSEPYTPPEVVMRRWLSFVIEAGMPWISVLHQVPRAQRNLARRIMLELHAQF